MQVHAELGACSDSDPVPQEDSDKWWPYLHCRSLVSGNCTAFPPDSVYVVTTDADGVSTGSYVANPACTGKWPGITRGETASG